MSRESVSVSPVCPQPPVVSAVSTQPVVVLELLRLFPQPAVVVGQTCPRLASPHLSHRGGSGRGCCGGRLSLPEVPPPPVGESEDAVRRRPAASAGPHSEAVGPLARGAGDTLGAAEGLGVTSLPTELTQRRAVPEHARGTGHTVVLPRLPAGRTVAGLRCLLHWAAVRDELGDLPVDPVLGTQVGGGPRGELLVEHVTSLAHRAALEAVAPVDAGHLERTT